MFHCISSGIFLDILLQVAIFWQTQNGHIHVHVYQDILHCSTRLKYPTRSYYVFTEPWIILQDYHNHTVMNSPNKGVTIDQVLSLQVPYVSNNLDFGKNIRPKKRKEKKKKKKKPECVKSKIIPFKLFILYKNCFSTSVQAFFCLCYYKSQSFDNHQRTKNTLQIALCQQTELPHPL